MKEEEKVIETDFDTAAEDSSEDSFSSYESEFKDIDITDTPFSLFEYLRQLSKGKVIIQPDFQRNQVWNNGQKSKFIESIILNYPLPPIYLNETKEAKYTVIDGLQRTSSINQFYNNEFALEKLQALTKYNGYRFSELPEYIRSKFEDKKLTIFILKPSTPMVIIYDLFNRINTGGTQLNRQEVRNCIFIGKSTLLLRELSEQPYFKKAIWWGIRDTRMKDREVILRYLAFRWFDFINEYSGDMSMYIESAMQRINRIEENKIELMKYDFKRVMELTFEIWGQRNFRIPTEQTRGTVNTAILESVCNFVSYKTDDFILSNISVIRENYTLLISNSIYYEAVTKSTGSKSKVLERFRIANQILSANTI